MQDENAIKFFAPICKALNRHGVRYLMVGGTAVIIHGYYRPTTNSEGQIIEQPDFDFWFRPTYRNYKKLLNAITAIGFNVEKYKEEEFPFVKSSFFKFKPQDYSLDFLPRVGGGLAFGACYQRRMVSLIGEVEVGIISLTDLITAKKFAGRPKDLEDIRQLAALHKL